MKKSITLSVNGNLYALEVDAKDLLLDVIREKVGLTGTKEGCGTGECGACTVLLDGEAVNSCLCLAIAMEGKEIVTVEGLGDPSNLHPLQHAFIDNGAVQCGFCTPGLLMSAEALLRKNSDPTEQEIREGIAGNICRCTGYLKIVQSIEQAASMLRQAAST
jgi:aerobic carbon-monoxide dehydrogenase small subunit